LSLDKLPPDGVVFNPTPTLPLSGEGDNLQLAPEDNTIRAIVGATGRSPLLPPDLPPDFPP